MSNQVKNTYLNLPWKHQLLTLKSCMLLFLGYKCASEGLAIRTAWGWVQLAGRRGDGRDLFQQLPRVCVCVLLCLVARCWKHSVRPAWRWESCLTVSLLSPCTLVLAGIRFEVCAFLEGNY